MGVLQFILQHAPTDLLFLHADGRFVNRPTMQKKSPVPRNQGLRSYLTKTHFRSSFSRVLLDFRLAECRTVWLSGLPTNRAVSARITLTTRVQDALVLRRKSPRFRGTGDFAVTLQRRTSAARSHEFCSTSVSQNLRQFSCRRCRLSAGHGRSRRRRPASRPQQRTRGCSRRR